MLQEIKQCHLGGDWGAPKTCQVFCKYWDLENEPLSKRAYTSQQLTEFSHLRGPFWSNARLQKKQAQSIDRPQRFANHFSISFKKQLSVLLHHGSNQKQNQTRTHTMITAIKPFAFLLQRHNGDDR